jgi:hypothetical protein
MARIRISLAGLMNALEDHCYYTHYYLDRETGEIVIQSEHDLAEREESGGAIENPFPGYDLGERFIPLEPMESRRGLDIMEAFAAGLPQGAARDRVVAALSKRKPYRNFKDALYDYPGLLEQWTSANRSRMKTIAEDWLTYNRIEYELVPHSGAVN